MPSLRQKVTTYFRQLSFIAEPRDGQRSPRKTEDDGNFIIKYLEGRMTRIFTSNAEIYNGKTPADLPDLKIGTYPTGPNTITAACTGPDEGLTGIKRSKLHLSASYADDIDFIDTIQESDCFEVRNSITNNRGHPKYNRFNPPPRKLNNNATTPTSDQNANRPFSYARTRRSAKSGIPTNFHMNSAPTTSSSNTNKDGGAKSSSSSSSAAEKTERNSNKSTTIVVSMVSTSSCSNSSSNGNAAAATTAITTVTATDNQNNQNILNSLKTDMPKLTDVRTIAASTTTTTTAAPATEKANAQTKESQKSTNYSSDSTQTNTKLLESTTERLLLEAVSSSQISVGGGDNSISSNCKLVDSIAGVSDWKMESDSAYGISVTLYETSMLIKEPMGDPIADCYGIVVRKDAAAMAMADGVNWGDGARLAARSAVHGCLDYLDRAIFGLAEECMATSTQEVFVSLLRSLWEGHGCILEVGGALTTLTIAVVLPLAKTQGKDINADDDSEGKYVVCSCNVGDSLGYVYSKKHGVREFTQASHDITSMRDMRDALGAIGPADGTKPELGNLTLSMTIVEKDDIVFLTSDGISDNFDPVVGKFAEAWTPDVQLMPSKAAQQHGVLAPKRQNKSASAIYARLHRGGDVCTSTPSSPPVRPPRTSKKSISPPPQLSQHTSSTHTQAPSRPKYMRSQTVIEPRRLSSAGNPAAAAAATKRHIESIGVTKIPRSISGLPLVSGLQRHVLTLYRLEDLLSYGINGTFSPCVSARRLCHLLIDFARMITSARRTTLEQRELFYKMATGPDGNKREVALTRAQHRILRKRLIDSPAFIALPGKLDHATVVAYTVGGGGGGGGAVGVGHHQGTIQKELNATDDATSSMAALKSKEFEQINF